MFAPTTSVVEVGASSKLSFWANVEANGANRPAVYPAAQAEKPKSMRISHTFQYKAHVTGKEGPWISGRTVKC